MPRSVSSRIELIPPLLPVPTGLISTTDRLCDSCQALDLSAEHFVVPTNEDPEQMGSFDSNREIFLGLLKDMRNKPDCPLCRLVLVALGGSDVPSFQDGQAITASMTWGTEGRKPHPDQPWHHIPQIRTLRVSAQIQGAGFTFLPKLNLFPQITLLANDAPTSSKDFFVRPIDEGQIDFSMIRNWISICEKWHGKGCTSTKEFDHKVITPADEITPFRVIDIINGCIVQAPKGYIKYAALSYVWGPPSNAQVLMALMSNIEKLEQVGALFSPEFHDQMPNTVLDAMEIVRKIDLQYLWVDALCIIQDDDSGNKQHAINNMDLVYGASFITIVAASGDSTHASIPGVRPGTRGQRQHIEEIKPGLRLAYKPIYQHYVKDAVYYTRAWTFQEGIFPARRLVFIGGQVVFLCGQVDHWREDVVCEEERIITRSTKPQDLGPRKVINDIGNFEGFIVSYSELSLTFQSDIYNAFAGMANLFRRDLKTDLCHGIPDAFFDWFLLWTMSNISQIHGPVQRRPLAPSWSWTGWQGNSFIGIWDWYGTRSIKKIRKSQTQRTWIIWYQRIAHNSTKCFHVLKHHTVDLASSASTPETKNFYGSHIRNRFPFDCTQTLPTPRKLVSAPEYYKDTHRTASGSGFLQFWTVSVVFDLDKPASEVETGWWRDNQESCVGIFGREGWELGIIFVSESWARDNIPGKHEFIVLCEARDSKGADARPAAGHEDDEDGGWKYRIMLLNWHSSGQWAERVSISSIEKENLNEGLDQGAMWKEIVLG